MTLYWLEFVSSILGLITEECVPPAFSESPPKNRSGETKGRKLGREESKLALLHNSVFYMHAVLSLASSAVHIDDRTGSLNTSAPLRPS